MRPLRLDGDHRRSSSNFQGRRSTDRPTFGMNMAAARAFLADLSRQTFLRGQLFRAQQKKYARPQNLDQALAPQPLRATSRAPVRIPFFTRVVLGQKLGQVASMAEELARSHTVFTLLAYFIFQKSIRPFTAEAQCRDMAPYVDMTSRPMSTSHAGMAEHTSK